MVFKEQVSESQEEGEAWGEDAALQIRRNMFLFSGLLLMLPGASHSASDAVRLL